jgi:hypothetical protein
MEHLFTCPHKTMGGVCSCGVIPVDVFADAVLADELDEDYRVELALSHQDDDDDDTSDSRTQENTEPIE